MLSQSVQSLSRVWLFVTPWTAACQASLRKEESEVAQSCPTLCDAMDCSPPVSSVHGILQARILEWVAISFSRGSSQPRDTQVSCIAGRRFILWATREAFPELAQTHVHRVGNAIQPSHSVLFHYPPVFNLSQHQSIFKWVSSSHQVAKGLEFQLQHQFFQWVFKTDFL